MFVGILVMALLMGGQTAKSRCASLSQKDMVNILTEYDVEQFMLMPLDLGDGMSYSHYGFTNTGSGDFAGFKKIFINQVFKDPIRRLVVLHEMQHVRQAEEKLANDETTVRGCAIRKYKEIYGGDLDLPEQMREFPISRDQLPLGESLGKE